MKVLLSAYACQPNWGSEPQIGWRWAVEIARLGHEVWILTHPRHKTAIEIEIELDRASFRNLHFVYLPPRRSSIWIWRRTGIRGAYFHYLFWQWGAYKSARRLNSRIGFDRVHHITYGAIRYPSFLGKLGIPFVLGPVGGGEAAPWTLRKGCGWKGVVKDAVRDLSNAFVSVDPLMRRTFGQAHAIFVTTNQSRSTLPRKCRMKANVLQAIGINPPASISSSGANNDTFRVLYVGRFLYWKGMHLGFPAFRGLNDTYSDSKLTLVGSGPDEKRWRNLAGSLGILEALRWVPWIDQEELLRIYESHQVLLFPSLHDSGAFVVLEAMSYGLPVVCLDLGGPAMHVDETCGRVIETRGRNKQEVVRSLVEALVELRSNLALRSRLSQGALLRARQRSWRNQVMSVYPSQATKDVTMSKAKIDLVIGPKYRGKK